MINSKLVKCSRIFLSNKVVPQRIQNKYFQLIRRKLLERITLIKSCGTSDKDSKRRTKTFFNFSYKKIQIPFWNLYTLFTHLKKLVMSRDRKACYHHQKLLFNNITPSPVTNNKI